MDVEELLQDKGVYFRPAGKDVLVSCLNPEHEDNNPSMRIDRLTGIFNCLSCGFKGNIFLYYNEVYDARPIKVHQIHKKITDILASDLTMPSGYEPFNREYRGIESDTYSKFNAFLHDDWDGRIVFPIYNSSNELIAFIGRYAFSNGDPKYLIKPDGVSLPIYPPNPKAYKGSVILVEGIFDVLNLYDKGITNCITNFGISMGLSKKKGKRAAALEKFIPLKMQGVHKIYILFDFGAEKQAAAAAELLSELFVTEVVNFSLFTREKDAGNLTAEEVKLLKEEIYG